MVTTWSRAEAAAEEDQFAHLPPLPPGPHVCEYVPGTSAASHLSSLTTSSTPTHAHTRVHRYCCTGYHRSPTNPLKCVSDNSVRFNPFSREAWQLGSGEQYYAAIGFLLLALVLGTLLSLWLAYIFHYRQQWAGMSEEEHPLGQLRRRLRQARPRRDRGRMGHHHVLKDDREEGDKRPQDARDESEEGRL